MHRQRGFDYSRPFFYMVTLKWMAGLVAFSQYRRCGMISNEEFS